MDLDEYRLMAAVEQAHWWYGATRALLAQLLRPHLGGSPRILDAGCGTGATGAWLAAHGPLTATDVEPLALTLHRELHPDVGVVTADVRQLPFHSGSFDLVCCVTVLYHRAVDDPAAVVRELVRTTRPGGYVCLMEPGVRRLRRAHDRTTHTRRRFSRADLVALVEDSGCQTITATGAYSFLVPAAAAKAVLERGHGSSDLARGETGLGGLLACLAALERRLLRHVSLPFGLSVIVIARVPASS